MSRKSKSSWPMIALGVITLVLSSYGLFELAHIFGQMPVVLALVAVAGFDVFAIACGVMAFRVAKDGDSPALWNFAVVVASLLSAGLQYVRTQLGDQPVAVGIMMAFFPLATVVLFEGTLRRAFRLSGRRTGRVAQPRASFEILQWLLYRRVTWEAFREGVRDRSLSADAAFKLAYLSTIETEPEYVPPPRREIEWDYSRQLGGQAQISSGPVSGSGPESAGPAPESRTIAELVRESVQVRGLDKAAVVADVLAAKPGANPESVRRTFTKESGLRSA